MSNSTADVVICGTGIAGIATAYYLAVNHGVKNILLVDERAPLGLTSDKSTECYRNWWPGPDGAMIQLMNRSIDLMEYLAKQSGNTFNLNRRGYLYVSADPNQIQVFKEAGEVAKQLGAGPLRIHNGQPGAPIYIPASPQDFEGQPDGADLILDQSMLRSHFPYLTEKAIAALHVRRAGWLSAQQLGTYLLEHARQKGVRLLKGKVTGIEVRKGRVRSVTIRNSVEGKVSTDLFVGAPGPFLKQTGEMLGIDLPVFSELHLKIACNDPLAVVPRNAPLLIWADPQRIPFSDVEHSELKRSTDTCWLLEEFPPGLHTRPEGGASSQAILILWAYHTPPVEVVWPPWYDPHYPEVVMRGLATMLPGMRSYFGKFPRPTIDGGYYTKTRENRPIISPLPVEGSYIIGALSGFGIMAACAAGELLAAQLAKSSLPPYAPAFDLSRYHVPAYLKMLDKWEDSGQL